MATARCLLCGGAGRREQALPAGFRVAECAECGLLYQTPRPTAAELMRFYANVSYCAWGFEDLEAVRRMKRATFDHYFAALEQVVPRGSEGSYGRLLDLGCGTGFLVERALERGWDAYGLELSATAAQEARRRVGDQRVFVGTLEGTSLPAGEFAAVTMFDFLEHVPDPRAVLTQVTALLRPGGATAIVTPYAGGFSHRWMGPRWSQFKAEHLQYFSPRSLRAALEHAGCAVDRWGAAPKCLTLDYMCRHMQLYPHPVLTPIARVLALMGKPIARRVFMLPAGDLFALARKSPAS